MSERDPKAEAVRYWWDKAFESLNASRRELAANAYGFAVNRAYYALFYAVSALLNSFSRFLCIGIGYCYSISYSGVFHRFL